MGEMGWGWGLCERMAAPSSFMILQERMFVGLYPDSSGKSLEGLKQTNYMIRFWSWKRSFPLFCEEPGGGQHGCKDIRQKRMSVDKHVSGERRPCVHLTSFSS